MRGRNPKVSVVIPTYNRAQVRNAIESVLAQTVSDLELSWSIMDRRMTRGRSLGRFLAIGSATTPKQPGRERSAEQGNRGSAGRMDRFSGSDDLWEKDKLEGSSRLWSDLAPSVARVTRMFDSSTTRKHGPSSKWRKRAIGMKARWASTPTC